MLPILLYIISGVNSYIIVKNNRFVDSESGQVFIVKGLAYQPTKNGAFIDPISNEQQHRWRNDMSYFKELGINLLRVYETDPFKQHELFMNEAKKSGIYVLFDLPSSQQSINRNQPDYTLAYSDYLKQKVKHFGEFENTFGFLIGNEVANSPETTQADAFVKAALRDVQSFIASSLTRKIPVGYAAVDNPLFRLNEIQYFSCDASPVDFYGLNIYSFCGEEATLETSGYLTTAQQFSQFQIPLLFTEFGCNTIRPRVFKDVSALYSQPMLQVFSGGIAYEYSEEANDYGLVKIDDYGNTEKLQDFDNLLQVYSKLSWDTPEISASQHSSVTCPAQSENWLPSAQLPPQPKSAVCNCIQDRLPCLKPLQTTPLSDQIYWACEQSQKLQTSQQACQSILPGNDSTGNGQFAFCPSQVLFQLAMKEYHQRAGFADCSQVSIDDCAYASTAIRVVKNDWFFLLFYLTFLFLFE